MSRQASVLLALFSGMLAACSGGNGGGSSIAVPNCGQVGSTQGQGQAMCLTSCNLGCTAAGCSVNQIAQNQPIILVFSQDVDPATVNSASISFRTATGEEPVGQYLVNGNVVTFLPQVRISGTQTFFGFKASQTYTMTLPGGANEINAVRSTSTNRLGSTYSCALSVSLGVVDLDGQPPTAKLISPSSGGQPVDPTTPIVLQFSELISQAPFIGTTLQTAPIKISVLRQDANGDCDRSSVPAGVAGSWQLFNDPVLQVTRATFSPLQTLPSTACVEIDVTNRIEDLSGKPCLGQFFEYKTVAVPQPPVAIAETFDSDLNLDREFSSGTWGNGVATPGVLGNDGLLGDFDPASGTLLSTGVYEWDTDDTLIPRTNTLSGKDEHITDGVYRFSRFILGRGVTVHFKGSHPPRIYVRGRCSVEGKIDISGVTPPAPNAMAQMGQNGGAGGPGGGAGGRGADAGDGSGNQTRFNGQNGEDVQVPAGHAYAGQAAGTGGTGSHQFPADGLASSVIFSFVGVLSLQAAAGGGGGGFAVAGQPGQTLQAYQNMTSLIGPPAAGGKAFSLYPIPSGTSAFDHVPVGGSGGGGGGSHPYRTSNKNVWRSGGGGAGGAGAIGFRAGGDLNMETGSSILAQGGSTLPDPSTTEIAAVGGGGSGGAVLLQAAGALTLSGTIDVSGGDGALAADNLMFMTQIEGGDGSHGYIRAETTADPKQTPIGTTVPDAMSSSGSIGVYSMTEEDDVVGSQSLWYTLPLVFPPQFLRYEVEATVDGQPMTFSDDPSKGVFAGPSAPVELVLQGAELDSQNQVNQSQRTTWTHYAGSFAPAGEISLSQSGKAVRAFRFVLLFHRDMASTITVDKVTLWYQP